MGELRTTQLYLLFAQFLVSYRVFMVFNVFIAVMNETFGHWFVGPLEHKATAQNP
jgi:hypothetical protein